MNGTVAKERQRFVLPSSGCTYVNVQDVYEFVCSDSYNVRNGNIIFVLNWSINKPLMSVSCCLHLFGAGTASTERYLVRLPMVYDGGLW